MRTTGCIARRPRRIGRPRCRGADGDDCRRPGDAAGLLAGLTADLLVGDPRAGHPVAVFGRAATAWQGRLECDSRTVGVLFAGGCAAVVLAGARLLDGAVRRRGPGARAAVTAAATWAVLGGTSLGREATLLGATLDREDLPAARARLPRLCGRDPSGLDAAELSRAAVESVAENTSDAAVAPLWWGVLAGVPGLLGYRAVNTLDAMVGHRTPRYARFGWAAARLDDLANFAPARLAAALTVLAAPPGMRSSAWRSWQRDGGRHPSPNAGQLEAAFAGALGVRLGGHNVYGGRVEERGVLNGDGRPADVADIRRAVDLSRRVSCLAAALAVVAAAARTGACR